MIPHRICAVVPTYDNPQTVGKVVQDLRAGGVEVIVVDDGSASAGREAAERCAAWDGVHVVQRTVNGGKGAAVLDGFTKARSLGFTHALTIDADGQHLIDDLGRFIESSQKRPDALILGQPIFDRTVPKGRLYGRQISVFWCAIETLSRKIHDPLCGYRVYPLAPCARLTKMGRRMDFDPEIAVRLVWAGVPTVNLPTKVRYLSTEEGGVSHFDMVRDNLRISWMHTKLVTWGLLRLLAWPFKKTWSLAFRGAA